MEARPELEDAHVHGWYLLEKTSLRGEIPSKGLFVKSKAVLSLLSSIAFACASIPAV